MDAGKSIVLVNDAKQRPLWEKHEEIVVARRAGITRYGAPRYKFAPRYLRRRKCLSKSPGRRAESKIDRRLMVKWSRIYCKDVSIEAVRSSESSNYKSLIIYTRVGPCISNIVRI